MNEKPSKLTLACNAPIRLCASFYPMILVAAMLVGTVFPTLSTAQSTTSFSFTAIPLSDPDIIAPFRGTEKWHDMNASERIDYPTQGAHQEPADAYYRSGISWDRVETSQGNYNWAIIDRLINACIDKNQKFNFNIMTLHPGSNDGINAGGANMKYPMYVHNQMQADGGNNTDWIRNGQWVPNWNSNFFLSRVEALLTAMAAHFNSASYNGVPYKNVIGYVDIGIFGSWGEWNHSSIINSPSDFPVGRLATATSLNRIIDAYKSAFPDYPLVAIMHVFDGNQFANVQVPPATGYYALTTSNRWGKFGIKRMNWGRGWEYYIRSSMQDNPTVYNGLRFGPEIAERWKTAPINGEGPCYSTAEGGNAPFWNLRNEVLTMHMSSLGNGNFCGEQNNATGRDNLRNALKLAGYRVVLESGNMTTDVRTNEQTTVTLNWKNIGNAPVYEFWDIYYELQNRTTNAVIWSGKSSHNLRFWLPQANATQVVDNFTIPSSVAAGTYKLVLKVRDPNGYRRPFPLAITGRLADGGYLLRDNIQVTAGNGGSTPTPEPPPSGSDVAVNAGQDQNLQTGATQANLTGTMTGATTGSSDTVNLVVIQGESNAAGLALNSQATAVERGARNNIQIINNNTLRFENLQLGLNNNILQNLGDQTTHGMELGLANAVDAGSLTKPTYLVKAGGSGSRIIEWLLNGLTNNTYSWTQLIARTDAAVNYLKSQNIPYKITVWQSIGINDYNAGTSTTAYKNGMVQLRNDFRTRYGARIPFLMTRFFDGHPYNAVINAIAAEDPMKTSAAIDVSGATYRDPNVHWDYNGFKIIAQRMVEKMAAVVSGPEATTAWTKVSGPAGGSISAPTSLNTTIAGLQPGTYVYQLTANGSTGVLATDDITIVVPATTANVAPDVSAGSNASITLPTSSTTLTGSATDSDGSIASYSWSQVSGPGTAGLSSGSSVSTSVNNLVEGDYVFRLTVADNDNSTATADVTVTVNPAPTTPTDPTDPTDPAEPARPPANVAPTANAGVDKPITLPTSSTNLGGSGTDSDGSITQYRWVLVNGPTNPVFTNGTAANTTVTNLTAQGTYVFRLTVTDNDNATDTDEVAITVNPAGTTPPVNPDPTPDPEPNPSTPAPAVNQAPRVYAGDNKTITLPTSSVTLTGSATDTDGSIKSYAWRKQSGTGGTINPSNAASTTVSGLTAGTYVFRLTATDDDNASAFDEVTIFVNQPSNQPPVANAGSNQTLLLGNTLSLNGANSKDNDGSLTTYQWKQASGPGTAKITTPGQSKTTVSNLTVGIYVFSLSVTDNRGAINAASVTIQVNAPSNLAPVIITTDTVKLNVPQSATELDASNSSDPDGKSLAYNWKVISAPNLPSLSNDTTAVTTLSGLVEGTYTLELTVTDGKGSSSRKNVMVIVTNPLLQTLKVYPNPATTMVTLQLNNKSTGKTVLKAYSISGVVVYTEEFNKQTDLVTKTFNISGLPNGTYILTARTGNNPAIVSKIQKIQ